MKRYLIVIEETAMGYSAYSPDLEGCVSTGQTREEVERNLREAIRVPAERSAAQGSAVLEPHTYSTTLTFPPEGGLKVCSRSYGINPP